jgi:hypothetical protein
MGRGEIDAGNTDRSRALGRPPCLDAPDAGAPPRRLEQKGT